MIELTKNMEIKNWSIPMKILFALGKVAIIVAFCVGISRGFDVTKTYVVNYATETWSSIIKRLSTVEIVREYVRPLDISTEELIKNISREYKVSPILTLAIGHQESGRELRNDRLRYEPKVYAQFGKKYSEETAHIMSSSIGIMQVIPAYHMKSCSLSSYADLFDRETNIRCGLKVLSDCLLRSKASTKVGKFKEALACYNGSDAYAEEVFGRLGELALENNLL